MVLPSVPGTVTGELQAAAAEMNLETTVDGATVSTAAAQAAAEAKAVEQVAPRQQVPPGGVQGDGEHVVAPPGAGFPQKFGRLSVQPEVVQQAMGVGQGLGWQEPAATVWPPHCEAEATTEHAPVLTSQQAAGCGQGLGSQASPAPWKVLPAAHPGSATKEHAPVEGLQHAPCCGHGEGKHTVPAPCHRRVLMPTQVDSVRTKQ